MHAPTLQIIPQQSAMDCSVVCLAMLYGVPYNAALTAFVHNVGAQGASRRQIQNAAKRLGRPLAWSSRVTDLETETGILWVQVAKWPNSHLVILKEGQVFDPSDATLWDVDVYVEANAVTVKGMFTVTPV